MVEPTDIPPCCAGNDLVGGMNQQSLNNGEEEKTVDAVSSQRGASIPKSVADSETLSLFVACEGQALDMYRENFGVTLEESLLHPMADSSQSVQPMSDKLNPLAALDAIINSFPTESDSDRISNVRTQLSYVDAEPSHLYAEPRLTDFDSSAEAEGSLQESQPAADDFELSGRETYAGLPIERSTTIAAALESTVEAGDSWQDDLVFRLEKNSSSSAGEAPGADTFISGASTDVQSEALSDFENEHETAVPQFDVDLEFSSPRVETDESWQDELVFPLRREVSSPDAVDVLNEPLEHDDVLPESAEGQSGGPKWASLTVSPSSRKWTDDESKNMETFFLGIVSDKVGAASAEAAAETVLDEGTREFVEPPLVEPSAEQSVVAFFDSVVETINENASAEEIAEQASRSAAQEQEERAELLATRANAVHQSETAAKEMFGLMEPESAAEPVQMQDAQPEETVKGTAKVDQAIDMFEDFLDSGEALSLMAELGVKSSDAAAETTEPREKGPAVPVDTELLDRAIEMLEDSLFEEAQVSARIFEALQARRLGNSLQKTEANWVIPMDRPLVDVPSDSWVFPAAAKEPFSDEPAHDYMVSPAPPLNGGSGRGANSMTGMDAAAASLSPAEEPSGATSPRDSMAGIPLRPNFTIVSDDEAPLIRNIGEERQQQLVHQPEEAGVTAVSTEGMLRAVQSLEQARELSIDSDNFVGMQDEAFGSQKKKTTKEIKDELPKTGERSIPRPSQEFLRIKSEDFSNPQELSQKLRALPLPSAEEKKEKDKELTPREIVAKYWSVKRGSLASCILAIIIFLCCISRTSDSYLAMGKAEFDSGHYTKAIECFKSALALNPQSLPAINYMGRSLYATHQNEAALEQFALLLKYDPTSWDALEGRAAIYASRTEWLLALSDLRSMVISHPGKMKAQQWLWYGTALSGAGDQLGAADAYSMAVKLDPGSKEARIGRMRALRKSGKASEAIAESNRFLESSPKDRDARLELARSLIDSGEFRAAAPVLQALASGHLRDSAVHFELGRAYAGLRDESNAVREFDLALRVRPALAAEVSSERLKLTKRIEDARRDALASGRGSTSAQVHPLMLEMAREQQSGHSSRRENSTYSSSESPISDTGSTSVGGSGETSAAVRSLSEAVKANPSDLNIRRRLAHALAAAKRPDEAAQVFDTVWKASAWSAEDELALADSYARAHKLDASINSYQRVVTSSEVGSPVYSLALFKQAQNLFLQGMKVQAAQYCRQGEQNARDGETRNRFTTLLRRIEANPY
ncbi:MAG: tetratricopeptide repeat protein [Candidatus Obscuribacterales bacterium]|nr:tetratricopeptide repeat protein [Candidatus Obscuribacterales bacterium]